MSSMLSSSAKRAGRKYRDSPAILNNIAKSAVTTSSITIPKKLAAAVMTTKGVNRNPIPFGSRLEEIKKFIEENRHSYVPRIHETLINSV
jgi:hypothetical protein